MVDEKLGYEVAENGQRGDQGAGFALFMIWRVMEKPTEF